MDPKYLHDTRKKLNDLAISHNRLTTLCACLLKEVQSLKNEVNDLKGIKTVNTSMPQQPQQQSHGRGSRQQQQQSNQLRYNPDPNGITSLRADEILQQLTLN